MKRLEYEVDRLVYENLFNKKVFFYPELSNPRSERMLPRLEEAEDRRSLDYNVFAGIPFKEFRFVSGIELEFNS